MEFRTDVLRHTITCIQTHVQREVQYDEGTAFILPVAQRGCRLFLAKYLA